MVPTVPIRILSISSIRTICSGSSTYNICSSTIPITICISCTTSYISSHTSPTKYTNPAATRWVLPPPYGQRRSLRLSFRDPEEPSANCHGRPVHHMRLSEGERVGGDVQLCCKFREPGEYVRDI